MTKERNFLFDNAKALLITLVVIGHFADYYTNFSEDMRIIFFSIYLFHMPLFIFIAGLFSKSIINGSRFKVEKVFIYLILYISLKLSFYILQKYILLNDNISFTFFKEGGLPWFMFAMAVWLCLIQLIKEVKPLYAILFSTVAAILVGYDSNVSDFLVSSRIIVYFPFFLLGYYLDPDQIVIFVKKKKTQFFSTIILLSTFIIIYAKIDYLYKFRPLLTGKNPYSVIGLDEFGGIYRICLTLITIVLSLSILSILPTKKTFYTIIGQRTLQIYFLHYIFLFIYHELKLNNQLMEYFPTSWLKIYILLSIIITLILTTKFFEKPFKIINSLKFKTILKTKLN